MFLFLSQNSGVSFSSLKRLATAILVVALAGMAWLILLVAAKGLDWLLSA